MTSCFIQFLLKALAQEDFSDYSIYNTPNHLTLPPARHFHSCFILLHSTELHLTYYTLLITPLILPTRI